MAQYPVSPKTQAAGLAGAVSGAALYLLQTYVFKGTVPGGVASLIYAAMPGVIAFAAAYLAPHQDRPIVTVVQPLPSNVTVVPAAGEDGEKLQAT